MKGCRAVKKEAIQRARTSEPNKGASLQNDQLPLRLAQTAAVLHGAFALAIRSRSPPANGYCPDGCCWRVQCVCVAAVPMTDILHQASTPAPPHLADGCWAESLTDGLPDSAPLLRVWRCQYAVVLGSSLQEPRKCQFSRQAQQLQAGRSVGFEV